MQPKESGSKVTIREGIGMISTVSAFITGVVALPFANPEQSVLVGTIALGLWVIGATALEPYLNSSPNNNYSTANQKK